MKLDPRVLLPAAAAAAALALPAGAAGDQPTDHLGCPSDASGWVLEPNVIAPDPSQDENGDFLVCVKGNQTKDNHNPTQD